MSHFWAGAHHAPLDPGRMEDSTHAWSPASGEVLSKLRLEMIWAAAMLGENSQPMVQGGPWSVEKTTNNWCWMTSNERGSYATMAGV